ncbi:MAG TPA: alpha/beta fold hydrolase [Syntrophomonadaceae bacterium]|nr:alpha/beta fold hydrolase [Syntrophomonadaceae bacterium]
MSDYSILDQPELCQYLFYPRRAFDLPPAGAFDVLVPVDQGIVISCRFFQGGGDWPWIIYFHGNGEVASDYNDIAPFYLSCSINLVVADYRGYGASTGIPGFAHLIKDAHVLYQTLQDKIREINPSLVPIYLMGRSLGSTSALELAAHYQDHIAGLIIESGFASVTRLIKHLNLPGYTMPMDDLEDACLDMIGGITCPSLIIHGEYDNLVPQQEGELVYHTLSSREKKFIRVPGASHNDIMFVRPDLYFSALQAFVHPK